MGQIYCPKCGNEKIDLDVGFDVGPTDNGLYEQRQHRCVSCNKILCETLVMENGTTKVIKDWESNRP